MENDKDLEEIFTKKFNHWDVDDMGNISRKIQSYPISFDQLSDMNWLNHIFSKDIDPTEKNEFYFVYLKALKNAGFQKITIDLEKPYKISAEK